MLKAVIFDMDGLMIDTENVTYQCYQEVLKTMNLSMNKEFYTTLLGRTMEATRQAMYKQYGDDFPIEEVAKKVHQLMDEQFAREGVPLKDGLVELLTYLKEHNYKTMIATSSARDRVNALLTDNGILNYFDDVICGNEVEHGKPAPDVFLNACQKLNVQPSEALVLEDSEAGIQAAHNAHISVICIPDMKYPDENYANKTTCILNSLNEVIDYIEKDYPKR